jgi:LysR family positive regulator for ilvC
MELRELQQYLHLCGSLHFGKTSREYHISPSSLSRLVKKLEEEVGLPLFERDSRLVRLTPAGEMFREYAAESLQRWTDLQRQLRQRSDRLSGTLSIFCSVTASYSFLHELLDQFRSHYPDVDIQLRTGDTALTIQRVLDEHEDVGIAALPDVLPEKLAFRIIRESPLVCIAPAAPSILREELDRHGSEGLDLPWQLLPLVLSETGLARSRVDEWFAAKGVRPHIYAQVAGNEAIVSMVSLGFGIGVVPQLVVENSPLSARIETLSVSPPLPPISIGICTLRRKLSNPVIKAFWDMSSLHALAALDLERGPSVME